MTEGLNTRRSAVTAKETADRLAALLRVLRPSVIC